MSQETNQLVKQSQLSQQPTQQTLQQSGTQQISLQKNQNQQKQHKKLGCYESIWKGIIRPPRYFYSINDLVFGQEKKFGCYKMQLLGDLIFKYKIKGRKTLNAGNSKQNILISLFEPMRMHEKPHNCIIYLHGNSSSRVEALGVLEFVVPFDMALCALDFSGCGLSEGDYVSLGFHEQNDVEAAINYIRNEKSFKHIKNFGLWGRSMGAVTAILASKHDDEIKVLVCDSPFKNLRQLCQELAWKQYKIPRCVFSMVFCCIRSKIQEQAQFDIDRLNIIKEVADLSADKSIMFLSANRDLLIEKLHPKSLYDNFRGYKKFQSFDGDHNSRRPLDIHKEITKFFIERLDQVQYGKTTQTSTTKQMRIQIHQVKPKSQTPSDESDQMIRPTGGGPERIQNHTFAFRDIQNNYDQDK